jgi:Xaa-Pro aminopeptidase
MDEVLCGIPRELAFPSTEHAARLARVRGSMARHGLDLLLLHHLPDVCYLTGFEAPLASWYACLVVPREGDLTLQTCERDLAALHTGVKDVVYVRFCPAWSSIPPERCGCAGSSRSASATRSS